MTYQHQFFVVRAINRIKSYVLGIENFLLSVLSLLSALKSYFFLSDLSELSGESLDLITNQKFLSSLIQCFPLGLGLGLSTINEQLSTK